jgi:hypothetical protein
MVFTSENYQAAFKQENGNGAAWLGRDKNG